MRAQTGQVADSDQPVAWSAEVLPTSSPKKMLASRSLYNEKFSGGRQPKPATGGENNKAAALAATLSEPVAKGDQLSPARCNFRLCGTFSVDFGSEDAEAQLRSMSSRRATGKRAALSANHLPNLRRREASARRADANPNTQSLRCNSGEPGALQFLGGQLGGGPKR